MRRMDSPMRWPRRGFTLVEMLVTITVIAIIIAILFPALQMARNSARDATCKSNLRQLYIGVTQYADSHTTFCSGAWDWQRDGCVTEVGWVADLVSHGTRVGDLLCPASPYPLHRVYQQLAEFDAENNACADSLGRRPSLLGDGSTLINACRQIAALDDPQSRLPLIHELVYQEGYNTNYAASWFLVRGEVLIDNATGQMQNTKQAAGCADSIAARYCTDGPLKKNRVGATAASSTIIPLFGCANFTSTDEQMFPYAVGPHKEGTPLCESYTRGPVDKTTMQAPEITGPGSGPSRWWDPWNATVQDYRNFGPVHGQKNGRCNVVFLDGSVGTFTDTDGDKLLNNGFEPSGLNHFETDTIELPPELIYSGWSLSPSRVRQK